MNWIVDNIWLIAAVPLAGAPVILALSKSQHRAAAGIAVLGQFIALAFSILAFTATLQTPGFQVVHNFTWFTFGDQVLRLGFVLDPLAAAMLVMITLVGLCIFVFSIGYMAGDKDFTRFFAYLSFFSAAMLGVVIANSLLFLFISWELVGLASYLLIGFWIERPSAAAAAKKSLYHYAHRRHRIFSSGCSGFIATAEPCCSMMVATAAWKRLGCLLWAAPLLGSRC